MARHHRSPFPKTTVCLCGQMDLTTTMEQVLLDQPVVLVAQEARVAVVAREVLAEQVDLVV